VSDVDDPWAEVFEEQIDVGSPPGDLPRIADDCPLRCTEILEQSAIGLEVDTRVIPLTQGITLTGFDLDHVGTRVHQQLC
jgi:hypothetical protein